MLRISLYLISYCWFYFYLFVFIGLTDVIIIYREEARQVWEKMEKEWEFERLARKQLIEEVVSCQKRQVS